MPKKPGNKPSNIKLIVLDVDGVMTDGRIIIGSDNTEYKSFDVKDGTGVTLAHYAGIEFAIISGRFSKVIDARAKELKIKAIYQDVMVKAEAYEKVKKRFKLKDENICFIGDEIIDITVLEKCGFSACPSDAVPEVKRIVDYVCKKPGGKACVREVIEIVLKKRGLWKKAVKKYLRYE